MERGALQNGYRGGSSPLTKKKAMGQSSTPNTTSCEHNLIESYSKGPFSLTSNNQKQKALKINK